MKVYFTDCGCEATTLEIQKTCDHDIILDDDESGRTYVKVASRNDDGYWTHCLSHTPDYPNQTYGEYFDWAYSVYYAAYDK